MTSLDGHASAESEPAAELARNAATPRPAGRGWGGPQYERQSAELVLARFFAEVAKGRRCRECASPIAQPYACVCAVDAHGKLRLQFYCRACAEDQPAERLNRLAYPWAGGFPATNKLSADTVAAVVRLHNTGHSYRAIATQLSLEGVTERDVKYAFETGTKRRRCAASTNRTPEATHECPTATPAPAIPSIEQTRLPTTGVPA